MGSAVAFPSFALPPAPPVKSCGDQVGGGSSL